MFQRVVLVGLIAAQLGACEKERRPPPVHDVSEPAATISWSGPAEAEALVTPAVQSVAIELGGTRRFPECWEFLEKGGTPLDPFPYPERIERAERLASCGLEASTKLPDGATALAWGSSEEPGSRARDLRIAVWEKDGKLRWSANMSRSRQAANWLANFRHSFIAALPTGHICVGTLWEGDTQVLCASATSGEAVWKGSLPFWSGMDPQPGKDGLVVADLTALTVRYPFNGSEMRHRKLDGMGGRAGYYSTDGKRLYFAPSRTETPPLIAYDLETFDEVWRTPLPAVPEAGIAQAFDAFDRILLKIGTQLVAVDTESGKVAWAYDVGDDTPSVASDESTIYVLSRLAEAPNRLVALDPATGKRRWSADTPTGTLHVYVVDGVLMIGSVRAVQHVTVLNAGAADGE